VIDLLLAKCKAETIHGRGDNCLRSRESGGGGGGDEMTALRGEGASQVGKGVLKGIEGKSGKDKFDWMEGIRKSE
jgi:hypothetical protein